MLARDAFKLALSRYPSAFLQTERDIDENNYVYVTVLFFLFVFLSFPINVRH